MGENNIEIPEKFKRIVEELEKMTVIELSELVKILEKKFGVSSMPSMVTPFLPPTTSVSPVPETQTKGSFTVVLKNVGEKKIEVIKIVREVTGKGLKESKDLVDAVGEQPQVIKENVGAEEANEIQKKFEQVGATVELK